MRIVYFDCFAGIAGDMAVAALLDLGVPLDHLQGELSRLALPVGAYALSSAKTSRHGIEALKFDVGLSHQHTHRHYAEIDAMIAASQLGQRAREIARKIFRTLAEAEACVHHVPVEDVHFHEVGAVDSIVDIVATAVCLEYLQVDQVFASALPLGSGFVDTAHGRLPVPAPATAELLKGLTIHRQCGPGERVTPTGAAIVAALAVQSGTQPAMRLEHIGCGAGSKDFDDVPNILRAFLGTVTQDAGGGEIMVAETNLDDSTAEVIGYTMERLFAAGALDVFFTPIQMKKNRPGTQLSFLCTADKLDSLARLVLTETSAIGLRYYQVGRVVLERSIQQRKTCYGPIRFKQVYEKGTLIRSTPEYEDCRRVAQEQGIPLSEVLRVIGATGGPEDVEKT